MKKSFLILLFCIFLTGCLSVKTIQTRALISSDLVTTTTDYVDLLSTGENPDKVREDFNHLTELWKGDWYLADEASRGVHVKSREVFLQKGTLRARTVSVGKVPQGVEEFRSVGGKRTAKIEKSMGARFRTNGKIISESDKYVEIAWPMSQNKIEWTVDYQIDPAVESNRKVMVGLFKALIAKEQP